LRKNLWKGFGVFEGLLFKVRLMVPVASLLVVSACVSNGGGGGMAWPVQSYPYACSGNSIPFEPSCVDNLIDNSFKYRGEFQACRQSVQSFEDAVNTFHRCKSDELKAIFDKLIKKVKSTYNCYVDVISANKKEDPSAICERVEVPRFIASYVADGVEYDFGIPNCVKKSKFTVYVPKGDFGLSFCKEDVEKFVGKGYSVLSYRSKSAQKQYDTYVENLRRKASDKIDEAVRKFNCKARGESVCF
jgi:hypothetical protein